jgi:hypothetical protein
MTVRFVRSSLVVVVVAACQPGGQTQPPTPVVTAPVTIDAESIRGHVGFLADDAQQGRAPGSESDTRVQKYVADAFAAAKLEPAFGDQWIQTFEITDGVRARAGQETLLDVSGVPVAHAMAAFSGESTAPVVARLVYVGHGIATEGKGTGDYAGLEKKVAGVIVVALAGGPDDPHLKPASTRAATKAITARDHGAAGFILWDPSASTFANGGEAADLGVPAVFVGQAGSAALVTALVGKAKGVDPKAAGLKRGDRSPKPGTLQTPIERVKLKTANVAGRVKGSGKSDRVIVVGAHMDHLGFGSDTSLAPGERAIHNGADDNASGVAAVIEICERAAATDPATRPFDLVCIAFGAEEMGLLGSKHYVQTLPEAERSKIAAMLNFDMVGRLGADGLVVAGAGTSKAWPQLIESNRGELVVRTTDDGYGPSDHGSFYEAKIPVLHFFTGPHEDYHKPSDDTDKINYDGAAQVANLASAMIGALQKDTIVPDYIEVARPAARGGGFNVSLGTIPDYGAKVDGVRMSGVRADGAAAKAGVVKGDIITKLGAREVHNLDDYMAAFAEMKPNVEIPITVVRDGKPVELKLVPEAPKAK